MADDEKQDEEEDDKDDLDYDSDYSYSNANDRLLRSDLVKDMQDIREDVRLQESSQDVLLGQIRDLEDKIRKNPDSPNLPRAKARLEGMKEQLDKISKQLAFNQVRIENIERRLETGGYGDAASSVAGPGESSISRFEDVDTSREFSRTMG